MNAIGQQEARVRYQLSGKAALVTGGTRGIGLTIAEHLAYSGARVTVCGRSSERGQQAVDRLKRISPDVHFVEADCGQYDDAMRAVSAASGPDGSLNLLCCAGAQGSSGPTLFHQFRPEEIEPTLTSRLMPKIYPIHAALPNLRVQGGAVLIVTTDAGRHATPGESLIGASGASLIALTKVMAREFSRWNVRVNSVALTLTSETPSWDRIFSKPSFEKNLFEKALSRFPAGRAPTAEEVTRGAH